MVDFGKRWDQAKSMWGLDEPVPVTDPETTGNTLAEASLVDAQQAFFVFTEKFAALSSESEARLEALSKYRAAVTAAYVKLLDQNCEAARKILAEVVNL